MNRSRASSRIARRQTKNSEKTGDIVNGTGQSLSQNGQSLSQIFDDIDLLFGNHKSKFYPIYTPPNKKVNTHNLAEIPSLQSDEDSILGIDNNSQSGENNNERNERNITPRKQYGKRKNANGLIESRNKFRQLLNQMQIKTRPQNGHANKNDSAFDGYELKSRRVKYEPKKSRKETSEQVSPSKGSANEFVVKVFEKSVDLTSYCKMNPNQSIPLYPICRLWARDKIGIPEMLRCKRNPQPPPMNEPPDPDGPYSASPVDVCHLPKPEPLPLDEDGNIINLRIPEKVRNKKIPRQFNDTSFLNSMENLSQEELLKLNMPGWKQTRRENLEALRQNEKRYRHSFAILKSIFDKANNSELGRDMSYYKYPPYESEDPTETQQQSTSTSHSSSSTTTETAGDEE
ncbi:myb-interacting protein 40 [Dermatophagoides pteronyssinus]|uniref:Cell cycle n=1 Tax=Dermatophagoides pteronyssinus TaxID=6956 RepID=A0ABQ8IS28_DERPT|nr:cell cycle [Dermatophagoides pteronyssinus]